MADDHTPIRRRKLSHEVEERLLGIIERGDLKPGDTLPSERQLMEAYGV
ncbi:MAG TPA: GntR family transcriptional regulator, partial [Afifellaceae bacterium]|nr:GntR family transcriptional regulator [Afifellaceae bacterium]